MFFFNLNIFLVLYFIFKGWGRDLERLKDTVSDRTEIIMHYHMQNTTSVSTAVIDAMNQMAEIVQVTNLLLSFFLKKTFLVIISNFLFYYS